MNCIIWKCPYVTLHCKIIYLSLRQLWEGYDHNITCVANHTMSLKLSTILLKSLIVDNDNTKNVKGFFLDWQPASKPSKTPNIGVSCTIAQDIELQERLEFDWNAESSICFQNFTGAFQLWSNITSRVYHGKGNMFLVLLQIVADYCLLINVSSKDLEWTTFVPI